MKVRAPKIGQLRVGPLSDAEQAAVAALAAATADADGVAPLSEVPLLRLREAAPWLTHIIIPGDHGSVLGYAQVDRSGDTASAELVVAPVARRHGIGKRLLAVASADARMPAQAGQGHSSGKELRVWAHGDLPAAQGFAAALGYQPVRELLLLSRPLASEAPPHYQLDGDYQLGADNHLAPGYRVREFDPSQDGPAWVELNAIVFADHPEQGRLTLADLADRQREPWFKAADFALVEVEETGQLAGFCWVKVPPDQLGGQQVGEIYAIGVHPHHRRRGISTHLLRSAFAQMARNSFTDVTLYVEGDNEAALATYYTAGFAPVTADIQYAKSPGGSIAPTAQNLQK